MKRKSSNCIGILSDQGKAATASNFSEYTIQIGTSQEILNLHEKQIYFQKAETYSIFRMCYNSIKTIVIRTHRATKRVTFLTFS